MVKHAQWYLTMFKIQWENVSYKAKGIYNEYSSLEVAKNVCVFLKRKYGNVYKFTIV